MSGFLIVLDHTALVFCSKAVTENKMLPRVLSNDQASRIDEDNYDIIHNNNQNNSINNNHNNNLNITTQLNAFVSIPN